MNKIRNWLSDKVHALSNFIDDISYILYVPVDTVSDSFDRVVSNGWGSGWEEPMDWETLDTTVHPGFVKCTCVGCDCNKEEANA